MSKQELIDKVLKFYPTWRGELEAMTIKELKELLKAFEEEE
jgi:hypothetical protein